MERDALTAKIDLVIELARELTVAVRHQNARIDTQNARIDALGARIDTLTERVGAVAEDVSWLRGRLENIPPSAEFYELRGRVEEISRRLPVPIGYTPPVAKVPAE